MNRHILPKAIAVVVALGSFVARAEVPPVAISSLVTSNDQFVINWTGGRPHFQVQTANNISGDWSTFGAPTSASASTIPMTNAQAFFRVVSDYTARYQVVFNATWSQQTLPTHWPANAHFSALVGGTHNASVHFWRDGETASEGIRLMAELPGIRDGVPRQRGLPPVCE